MQERTYAAEADPGTSATVAGWVHEIRDLGGIAFLILRDTTGKIQIKIEKDELDEALVETALDVHRESVLRVEGDVEEEERAPTGVEVTPDDIEVIAPADPELPLDPSGKVDAELPTRLDNRTLDLRKPEVKAIFEIRAEVLRSVREAFRNLDATEINTPKIVATGTEGGTELFPITYFGREAFMNQSPQLFKQLMVGSGLERVFEIGPIFRAEEHNTPRHLNEATSIDFESAFYDHTEAMDACETVVKAAYEGVAENCADELETLGVTTDTPRMIACEPAARAPHVAAINSDDLLPSVEPGDTDAHSIQATQATFHGVTAIEESGGDAIGVSDEAISAAQDRLAAAGLWQEFSGSAGVAGLRAAIESDWTVEGPVVCLATSSGFKDGAGFEAPLADSSWESIRTTIQSEYGVLE